MNRSLQQLGQLKGYPLDRLSTTLETIWLIRNNFFLWYDFSKLRTQLRKWLAQDNPIKAHDILEIDRFINRMIKLSDKTKDGVNCTTLCLIPDLLKELENRPITINALHKIADIAEIVHSQGHSVICLEISLFPALTAIGDRIPCEKALHFIHKIISYPSNEAAYLIMATAIPEACQILEKPIQDETLFQLSRLAEIASRSAKYPGQSPEARSLQNIYSVFTFGLKYFKSRLGRPLAVKDLEEIIAYAEQRKISPPAKDHGL